MMKKLAILDLDSMLTREKALLYKTMHQQYEENLKFTTEDKNIGNAYDTLDNFFVEMLLQIGNSIANDCLLIRHEVSDINEVM